MRMEVSTTQLSIIDEVKVRTEPYFFIGKYHLELYLVKSKWILFFYVLERTGADGPFNCWCCVVLLVKACAGAFFFTNYNDDGLP